jgi:hypothetical protein
MRRHVVGVPPYLLTIVHVVIDDGHGVDMRGRRIRSTRVVLRFETLPVNVLMTLPSGALPKVTDFARSEPGVLLAALGTAWR